MELRYFGHSMFALSSGGTTIVIDPWDADLGYTAPNVAPDAIVVSHEHFDHSNVKLCQGSPSVVRGLADEGKAWAPVDTQVGPVRVTGVASYHDTEQGAARGKNTITIYEAEGLRLVHLGDLGHVLTDEQRQAIGHVDVLMIPVGGHFTIGPAEVDRVVEQLTPRVVIPMHFKTDVNASWPIRTLDDYLRGRTGVKRVGQVLTLTAASLPKVREIWPMV